MVRGRIDCIWPFTSSAITLSSLPCPESTNWALPLGPLSFGLITTLKAFFSPFKFVMSLLASFNWAFNSWFFRFSCALSISKAAFWSFRIEYSFAAAFWAAAKGLTLIRLVAGSEGLSVPESELALAFPLPFRVPRLRLGRVISGWP